MSTTMMHPAHSGHEPAVAIEQLSAREVPEFAPGVRNAILTALAFEVLLLASIAGWLCWGMQHYQNIQPFVRGIG